MKTIPNSRREHHLVKVSIFLITAALIAGMAGCVPVQYNLTTAVAPGDSGTATDLTNASPYAAGTEVGIKAVANSGYWFVNWTAPAGTFANANAPQTTFTMPGQDVTVTANFEPSEFYGGNGTAGDPYQIADWHQLDYVRNYLNSYFVLVNNLDSTTAGYEELASPTANGGKGWQPIGTTLENPFTGTFDGQGHEIRDLFINRPDEDCPTGLFGWVISGVIKDIGMVNIAVTGNWGVGGLVGEAHGTVSNSYSSGTVSGINWAVGGLVGRNSGTVSNSYSTASVTSDNNVGGLVGENGGTVSNSYSSGDVTSYYNNVVGGLVGANYDTVSNSYSTGSVTGSSDVGGLVGVNGYGGTVSNSYSTGSVSGGANVGGLVGANSGTVSNSFWDTETSGQATSDGGTGKNTTEMQNIITFSGAMWDIIAVALNETNPAYIWNIVDEVTYPFLSWQPV
jgi:hypothetical protein